MRRDLIKMSIDKQTYRIVSKFPTKLTEEDLIHIRSIVLNYLKTNEFVTNRILREIVGVTYDQAIFFYGQMLKRKVLQKVGTASGTRYILSTKKPG